MPLRDHFRPPLSDRRSWDELHGGWPMMIVADLNRKLPDRYVAVPLETWSHLLELGEPLPTLPLWLGESISVPLELESSYEETCRIIRLP